MNYGCGRCHWEYCGVRKCNTCKGTGDVPVVHTRHSHVLRRKERKALRKQLLADLPPQPPDGFDRMALAESPR